MRIIWTDPAKRDLVHARAWIAQDRPRATAQVARIIEATSRLRDFPHQGRLGREGGARELVVPGGPFLVAYRVRDETIEILRVMHGSRRWPANL